MENAEEIFHFLEDFSKRKPKTIPQELNDYLAYVARTGDPVYQWSLVKCLFKEKLLNVITDFYETTPGIDIPPYPNVDPFNYDIMKNSLLERLDSFTSAPFTVQRICELLTFPRKQYNRIDKYMRAIEKNILVVSTREPGVQRHAEPENGDVIEPVVNGTDNTSEYNVDVEMEDMSWKESSQRSEPQPSSSDTHISVDDIEARLQAKQNTPMETQEKTITEYESVTPPELNVGPDEPTPEIKDPLIPEVPPATVVIEKSEATNTEAPVKDKVEIEVKLDIPENPTPTLVIPEITVDDAEMTEQKLIEQAANASEKQEKNSENKKDVADIKPVNEVISEPQASDESSSDSNMKEEETKHISEISTSSEESSSSSDNTDGNSNSPKTDEISPEIHEESNHAHGESKTQKEVKEQSNVKEDKIDASGDSVVTKVPEQKLVEPENYTISDVNSELRKPEDETPNKIKDTSAEEATEPTLTPDIVPEEGKKDEEKTESTETVPESSEL